MGYLRCEACGAKALSAASTCPKCSTEFEIYDGRGQRASLKRCSGCGIMHRQDRACHWCGEVKAGRPSGTAILRSVSGIAAVALVAVGSWAVREPAADAFARIVALSDDNSRRLSLSEVPEQLVASAVGIPAVSLPGADLPSLPSVAAGDSVAAGGIAFEGTLDTAATSSATSPATSDATAAATPGDTTQWVPATASTWVNVRSYAGRRGAVVGIIKPSEKAMLGSVGRGGYRQVKAPEMSGWVDPRLFVADSVRSRGL